MCKYYQKIDYVYNMILCYYNNSYYKRTNREMEI